MFVESFIAAIVIGVIIGIPIGALWETRNAARHIAYYRGRSIRHLSLAEQARKPHLGTPYLSSRSKDAIVLEYFDSLFPDTHSGSRRAELLDIPGAEIGWDGATTAAEREAERENVVPMQVQTGRPA